jgi:hypothetical protein
LNLHHLAEFGAVHAVNGQSKAIVQKGIVNLLELAVKRYEPISSGLVGIPEEVLDQVI